MAYAVLVNLCDNRWGLEFLVDLQFMVNSERLLLRSRVAKPQAALISNQSLWF